MPKEKFGYGSRRLEKGVQKYCKKCGKVRIVERGRKTCPVCKGRMFP